MNNLLAYFLHWEKTTPDAVFLRQPFNGVWKTWTWAEAGHESRSIAGGLKAMGIKPGDHVAILSKNCAHWIMADVAILMCGCVSIPIYPTLSANAIEEILKHSGSKAIIIGKLDNFGLQEAGIPAECGRIGVQTYGIQSHNLWENLVKEAQPLGALHQWNSEDIFTIIYTSGTTGKSKGVMHNSRSIHETLTQVMKRWNLKDHPRLFSYLPLSHIAERMAIESYGLRSGALISFAESLDSFAANLVDARPDIFIGVPRIWGKFQEGILKKLPQKKLSTLLSIPLLGMLIKNSIRKKLGLHWTTLYLSGAAPISAELQTWFKRLGIDIVQVYGMTEDSVYAHMNRPGENKYGTVGKPLPGLDVKFGPEGDIRVKSVGNFQGYYKEPELTAEAFDEEGYLKTGDIGEYDSDGFLTITGRAKDQFKTDKGKYISPAPIELKLLDHPLVEQVCVVGTGIPQPIALVVPTESGRALSKTALAAELATLINTVNVGLENYERLEKAVVLCEPWTIENGMLTPSLKVKRNEVEKQLLPHYPMWFVHPEKVVWEEPKK